MHIICLASLERGSFDGKKHPMGVGDAATLAQCWPSIHEAPYKWGLSDTSFPQLHIKFENNLASLRPCLKK